MMVDEDNRIVEIDDDTIVGTNDDEVVRGRALVRNMEKERERE